MTLSAWWLLPGAIPVLMLGQWLIGRVRILDRYNIPVPVVGGLTVAILVLLVNLSGAWELKIDTKVSTAWWTWIVTTPEEWARIASKDIYQPMLVGFFTCIGLSASIGVARKGGFPLLIFLGISMLLAVLQNVVGVALAKALGTNPQLGLICGSVTLVGGLGTAIGLSDSFVKAGFEQAAVVGATAATFGMVIGGILGGSIGGNLIRKHRLHSQMADSGPANAGPAVDPGESETLWTQIHAVIRRGWRSLAFFLLLIACIKIGAIFGAWGSKMLGQSVPAQMGAMMIGLVARNLLDLTGKKFFDDDLINAWGGVLLTFLLAVAMTGLNLIALKDMAGPMLIILLGQIVLIVAFCYWVCFRVMGRSYDAALMSTGMCGFGLGGTHNALASMETLTAKYGPSPKAFLIVSIVGGFLIDPPNILMINSLISWLQ